MKVLIVPDKFKGTLDASAVSEAIADGWRRARPKDAVELLPMSDGGDGFGHVISRLLHAKVQTIETIDAAHRPRAAQWWWEPESKTAIIESATVIGLALLPPGKFHPFDLDTLGLAGVFRAASARKSRRLIIGIGGSATNDAGFGLACGLGCKFFDAKENAIEQWTRLDELARIERHPQAPECGELTVAVDVQNPLLGARGATRVYGPQKGLMTGDLIKAERCLRRLANVFEKQLGGNLAKQPGAGAAGGLGYGLGAFLNARVESGFDFFARASRLHHRLPRADLVITGEGCVDESTFMGKGVGKLVRSCRTLGIPCLVLAGAIERTARTDDTFLQMRALTDLTTSARAKSRPAQWLGVLAREASAQWSS